MDRIRNGEREGEEGERQAVARVTQQFLHAAPPLLLHLLLLLLLLPLLPLEVLQQMLL